MMKREDMEALERQVRPWLEKMGIPYESYRNLSASDKGVLHNLVCTPTHPTTYAQRKDLYKRLCLPDIAGRESIDPVDFMPDDKLQEFFSPLTPSERLPYLYKF